MKLDEGLTKRIYLASPYSPREKGLSKKDKDKLKDQRYQEITRVAGQLEDAYPYAFILPITMSHNTAKYMKHKNSEFKNWAQRDLTYIACCHEMWIVTMDDWQKSIGIRAEVKFAKSLSIPIKYVCPALLLVTNSPANAFKIIKKI